MAERQHPSQSAQQAGAAALNRVAGGQEREEDALRRRQQARIKEQARRELEKEKQVEAEIAKVKTPAAEFIPECPICLHRMAPPTKIVHCIKGHKLCETCSGKETVKSCPTCKTAFMGRDFGMEAFVRELSGEN